MNKRKRTLTIMPGVANSDSKSREDAATELIGIYQDSLDKIREGRYTARIAILEGWNDWYNNLATICFGLGGALVAAAIVIPFKHPSEAIAFWVGTVLLILDGVLVLLTRLRTLELDIIKSQSMGYEAEYYFLVAKNRLLDIIAGRIFKHDEFEDAKNKGLAAINREFKESYSSKLDFRIDLILTAFLAGFGFLGVSALPGKAILPASIGLVIVAVLFFLWRLRSPVARKAIAERDKWLEKIEVERKLYEPKKSA